MQPRKQAAMSALMLVIFATDFVSSKRVSVDSTDLDAIMDEEEDGHMSNSIQEDSNVNHSVAEVEEHRGEQNMSNSIQEDSNVSHSVAGVGEHRGEQKLSKSSQEDSNVSHNFAEAGGHRGEQNMSKSSEEDSNASHSLAEVGEHRGETSSQRNQSSEEFPPVKTSKDPAEWDQKSNGGNPEPEDAEIQSIECPSSGSLVGKYAYAKVVALAHAACEDVRAEILFRAGHLRGWIDPSKGRNAANSYKPLSGKDMLIQRITPALPHFTDHIKFHLISEGESCRIHACSVSQGTSGGDFNTNYCNIRNLYCSKADGCKPVEHDFVSEEQMAFSSCGERKWKCVTGEENAQGR